jgi:hypothetical protein
LFNNKKLMLSHQYMLIDDKIVSLMINIVKNKNIKGLRKYTFF